MVWKKLPGAGATLCALAALCLCCSGGGARGERTMGVCPFSALKALQEQQITETGTAVEGHLRADSSLLSAPVILQHRSLSAGHQSCQAVLDQLLYNSAAARP